LWFLVQRPRRRDGPPTDTARRRDIAEYRKGYKVDPSTGLTQPEERAGVTREEAEARAREEADTPSQQFEPTPKTQMGTTGLKLLQGLLERMLFWTIVVVLGAVVLIVLQLLGYG
jgi:hypothetical protein